MGNNKSPQQKQKDYDRFYDRAFAEMDLEKEIISKGGAKTLKDFEQVSKQVLTVRDKGDYWDKMFNKMFTGRDTVRRVSKFQTLGQAIYTNYFEGKHVDRDERVKRLLVKGKYRYVVATPFSRIRYGSGKVLHGGNFLHGKTYEEAIKDLEEKLAGRDPSIQRKEELRLLKIEKKQKQIEKRKESEPK